MLSQTSEYALRAALHLARQPAGTPVKLGEIADALDVPRNYLSKTLYKLARAGVLASGRGPAGGFQLARPADRMTLAEVIAPFDPFVREKHCLLGGAVCSDETACTAHHQWKEVATRVRSFFRDTTLTDLISGRVASPLALTA